MTVLVRLLMGNQSVSYLSVLLTVPVFISLSLLCEDTARRQTSASLKELSLETKSAGTLTLTFPTSTTAKEKKKTNNSLLFKSPSL